MLDVALIGTGGMMPLPDRFLTSMICRLNGSMLMIDSGECTQVTLKMLGWGFKNIDVICFTHFHADHISGLPGLLLTIGNSGRTEPLTLIGPKGLWEVVRCLCVIAPLPFRLIINELECDPVINLGEFAISALPLDHRVECYAYSIEVKRRGKFDVEKAKNNKVPMNVWSYLQRNDMTEFNGKIYTSDMVLGSARKGIKVSYCTDTRPLKGIAEFVRDSDLFICEGIHGEADKLGKAIEHKHMIFSEAAEIAKHADVKEMWLTHFSPALTNPEAYLKNATDIFENTIIGYDRISKTIRFE